MSVDRCAVTAISKPEGTAASAIQVAASRHVGRAPASSATSMSRVAPPERHDSTPQTPISTISARKPIDQARGLLAEPRERLDHERIAEQRQDAADIARGIEEIRILGAGMVAAGKPRLQQRRVGGKRKERQADRDREQPEQPQGFTLGGRTSPAGGDGERQGERRRGHHGDVDERRDPCRHVAREQMGIGIAEQQRGLEEHDGHRPHRGRPAELRQHHLGEHRLHREQERGAEENRGCEDGEQRAEGDGGAGCGGGFLLVYGHAP